MLAIMDGLVMHAPTHQEHDKLVLEVLQHLKDNRLCIVPEKCEWAQHQVQALHKIKPRVLGKASTTAPVLWHFDPNVPAIVKTGPKSPAGSLGTGAGWIRL